MTSVAFASMEVSGGPIVGFQGHGAGAAGAATASSTAAYGVTELLDRVNAARRREEEEENRAESSGSSSIGIAGESSLSLSSSSSAATDDGGGGGDGEEEVQSELKEGALGSLASLEECLPIKRGLSNCFAGKSKSFASLADAASLGSAGALAKPENPFNKRRRILMACKASWQRRASYDALNTSALRVLEEDEDEDEDDEEARRGLREESLAVAPPPFPTMDRRLANTTFRSPRSFSLTDLQHA